MSPSRNDILDFPAYLEAMTESVLVTSADLTTPGPTILYVNPAFEQMTGWTSKEILGQNPRVLQGPKTDMSIFHRMREKLLNGETWRGQTVNYRKDGSEFHMQWSIVPIRNADHEIHQFLAVQTDVTQRVEMENSLELARKQELKRIAEIDAQNKKMNGLILEQRRTLELFSKYVPPTVVDNILSTATEDIKESIQLDVALLFCDIRQFTSIAESLQPRDVGRVLDLYYTHMSEVITRHHGTITQFVGDEIFVSFGAPLPIDQPVMSAVRCALEMVDKLSEVNKILLAAIHAEIVVGIGIHFGPVVAGNLGSREKLSYSITGDAVNTAKRIESLTKSIPNGVLISQTVNEMIDRTIKTAEFGEVSIRGKSQSVMVYRVLGAAKQQAN